MMVLAAGTGPQRAPHDADRSLCEKVNPPFGTVFVGGSATYRYAGFCYGGTTASFNRSFVSIDLESAAGGAPRFRGQTALKAATFAFSRPYDNNPDAFFVDEAIVLVAVGAPGGTVAECEASAFRSGTIDARTSTCALEKLTVSLDDLARPTKLRVAFADGGREEVPLFDLTLPP
jgi:hypothetical protein